MHQLQAPYDFQAAARKSVFQRFDAPLAGHIGVAALDSALQSMGAQLPHSHLGALAQAFPGDRPGSIAYMTLNRELQEYSPDITGRAAVSTGGRVYDTAQSVPGLLQGDVQVADALRRLARRNANRSEGVLAALFSRYAVAPGDSSLSPLGLTLPQFGLALREVFGMHMQPTELRALHTAFDGDNDGHVRPEDFARRVAAVEQALLKGRQWAGRGGAHLLPTAAGDTKQIQAGDSADTGSFLGALQSAGAGTKYAGVLSRNRGVVRSLFRGCDEDGSGSLSVDEFRTAMLVLQLAADEGQATRLARCFDSDGSGGIDFLELVDGFLAASGRCTEAAQAQFPGLPLHLLPAQQHAAPASDALVRMLALVGRLSARQLVARHAELSSGRPAPGSSHTQAREVFTDVSPYGASVFDFGSMVSALRTVAPACPPPAHRAVFQWFDPNGDGKVSYPAWVDSLFLLGASSLHAISSAFHGQPPLHLTLEHCLHALSSMTPQQLDAEQRGKVHVPQPQPPPEAPAVQTWAWRAPALPAPTQAWQPPPPRPDAFVLSSYLDITGVSDEIATTDEMGTWTARRRTGRSGGSAPPPSAAAASAHIGFAPVPRPSQAPQLPPRHELAQSQPIGGTEATTEQPWVPGSKALSHTWGGAGTAAQHTRMGPWEHSFDLSSTMGTTDMPLDQTLGALDTSALLRASWDSVAHGSAHAPSVAGAGDNDAPLGRSLRWSNSARERKAQDEVPLSSTAEPVAASPAGGACPQLHIQAQPAGGEDGDSWQHQRGLPPAAQGYFTSGGLTPGWSTPVLPSGALSGSMAGFPPAATVSPSPQLYMSLTPQQSAHPLSIPAVGPQDWSSPAGAAGRAALLPSTVSAVGERTRQAVLHLRAGGPLMAAAQQAAATTGQSMSCAQLQQALSHCGLVLDSSQMLALALHLAAACTAGVLGDNGQPQADLGGQALENALQQHGLHSTQATVSPQQLHRWLLTAPIRKQAARQHPPESTTPATEAEGTPRVTPAATPRPSPSAIAEQRSLRRWTRQGDPTGNAKLAQRRGGAARPPQKDQAGLALATELVKHSKVALSANAAALKLRRMFRRALVAEGNLAASRQPSGAAREAVLQDAMQALQAPDSKNGCSVADMAAALQGYGLPGRPPSEAAFTSALKSVNALRTEAGTARVQVAAFVKFLMEGALVPPGPAGQHLPATQRLSALLRESGKVAAWENEDSPRRDTAFAETLHSPAGKALGAVAGVGDLAAWHGRGFWTQVDTLEHALSLEVRARASSISGARGDRMPSVTMAAAGLRSPPVKHATFELRDAFHFLGGSAAGGLSLPVLHAALHRLGLLPPAPQPYPLAPTQQAAAEPAAHVVELAATPTAVALARAVFCRLLGHEDFHGNGMPKQNRMRAIVHGQAAPARASCLYDRLVYFSTMARWAVPLNGRLQGVFDRLMQHLRHKAHRGAGVVDWSKSFASTDTSGDGILQTREFSQLLRKLVPDVSTEDVQALANAFDRDGNGSVDLEEFVTMMRQR